MSGFAVENPVSQLCPPLASCEKPASENASSENSGIKALTSSMARGDETSFHTFCDLYGQRLLRYLLVVTRGSEDAAREALQLTLVRIARHVKRFDTEEGFWSWLTVLARSSVVDEHRKRTRFSNLLQRFFHRQQLDDTASQENPAELLASLLETNLAALPEGEREVVERKYFSGQSVKEIAAELRSTDKAIESQLVRIRRKLKESILRELHHEKQN